MFRRFVRRHGVGDGIEDGQLGLGTQGICVGRQLGAFEANGTDGGVLLEDLLHLGFQFGELMCFGAVFLNKFFWRAGFEIFLSVYSVVVASCC